MFELVGGVKAATSAGRRVAHEEEPPHNPGASHALAFGVPRITQFQDLLQTRIDPRAASLSYNNSRIRLTLPRQKLEHCRLHRRGRRRGRCYYDLGMLVGTEMGNKKRQSKTH